MDRAAAFLDGSRAYAELLDSGNDWADKLAAAEMYEEQRRSVLAEIKLRVGGKSDAEREMVALATAEYRDHVRDMVAARREANRARVRYDAVKVLAELRRTEESSRRAELNLVRTGAVG